jgi:hypothetical protein
VIFVNSFIQATENSATWHTAWPGALFISNGYSGRLGGESTSFLKVIKLIDATQCIFKYPPGFELNIPAHGHGPLHFSFTPAHLARHGLANDFPSSPQTLLYSRVQRHALPKYHTKT